MGRKTKEQLNDQAHALAWLREHIAMGGTIYCTRDRRSARARDARAMDGGVTMATVIIRNVWLCDECTIAACNDDYSGIDYYLSGEAAERRVKEIGDGLARLGPISLNSDENEGTREESSAPCDCCRSPFPGRRDRFAIMGEATPFGPERARELWAGRSLQNEIHPTDDERRYVDSVWAETMGDGSSWMSAFMSIMNGGVVDDDQIAIALDALGWSLKPWLSKIVESDDEPRGLDPETERGRIRCDMVASLGLAQRNGHGEFRSTPLGRRIAAIIEAGV
jgi:hypothetical protein